MAKRCDLCGKGPQFGNNVSHSHMATKKVRIPNLHTIRRYITKEKIDIIRKEFPNQLFLKGNTRTGKREMKVCSSCLKKMDRLNI